MGTLSQYLERKKLTQAQFAAQLGTTQSFVSRLVHGRAQPSLGTAFRIEQVTGGEVPATSWNRLPHEAAE